MVCNSHQMLPTW